MAAKRGKMIYVYGATRQLVFHDIALAKVRAYRELDRQLKPYEIRERSGQITFMQGEQRATEIVWEPDA